MQLDGPMERKRHELLSDLEDHAVALMLAHDVPDVVADAVANALAAHMANAWGGQVISWPMDYRWRLSRRNAEMYAAFREGASYGDLAARYGRSERQIRHIMGAVQKRLREQAAANQRDIFADREGM